MANGGFSDGFHQWLCFQCILGRAILLTISKGIFFVLTEPSLQMATANGGPLCESESKPGNGTSGISIPEMGLWNNLSSERQTQIALSLYAKESLRQHLSTLSFQSKPYLQMKKEDEEGLPLVGNDRFEGYCSDLAEKLAEIIHIEYIIKLVADGKYGNKNLDGTWNGMVGELTRNVSGDQAVNQSPGEKLQPE